MWGAVTGFAAMCAVIHEFRIANTDDKSSVDSTDSKKVEVVLLDSEDESEELMDL